MCCRNVLCSCLDCVAVVSDVMLPPNFSLSKFFLWENFLPKMQNLGLENGDPHFGGNLGAQLKF